MWWGPQGRWSHQSPGVGAPGRWGSASLFPGNAPPQSRSRWEASGSPRLAVIHAGCAGAFTAEQRPAPRGAGRSGEASGSPGLLDCSCLLRGEPGPRTALAGAPPPPLGRRGPAALCLEGVGLGAPSPCAVLGLSAKWLPASCAVWPGIGARSLRPVLCGWAPERGLCRKTRQAQPRSSRCPPVKSSAQLAGFPWQQK